MHQFVKRVSDRLDGLGVLSRVASVGLTTVLIISVVFNVRAAGVTRAASDSAKTAHALDDEFQEARYAVGAEESLNRKYRLEPDKRIAAQHRESADSLTGVMRTVLSDGNTRDRAVARNVLAANRSYLDATEAMYAAVDRHDTPLVISLDHRLVDPVFGRIERAVEERSRAHSLIARDSFERLDETQRQLVGTTIVLSMLGLTSLGIFLIVLVAYRRRLTTSHDAQLERLERAALVDSLTGIGNHRAYQEDFKREVSRAQRYGETLTLVVLDIDDFKVINDRNGHMHGDEVLKALAELLSTMRTEDRPYRLGGDEFAVLLPHTTTPEAMEMMRRLSALLRTQAFGATVSTGIATAAGMECDLETLRAQADAAMYFGKRAGRNDVTAFDASTGGMWPLSAKKIHNLRELIAGARMEIAFQPIWDVERGRVLAYEALARPDLTFGFDGPQEAFDLAERIGRAHELDAICRSAALEAAGRGLPDDALLFVNVSPQSLDRGRLDSLELLAAVRAAGLPAERVVIEITERSITRVDTVIEAARALQNQGFRLALDDTGAGNSGLEIMSRLTFDFVKIDREVIVKGLYDKNARGVLAGIIAIADATGAYVIAEGIENQELLAFVCDIGKNLTAARPIQGVQGYLLQRPSRSFPTVQENDDIRALLQEFAKQGARV